ncbi:phosphoethanolamine transferase [Aestuariibaculum sediminum]|uniref:Phosphoethanolamine transferase n=1 Tax=Aestuariibaculum sediminum TaxID=2770637 RepID=A0A8J6Q933_9FLAO|nr:phosphoethanolamine transferase [Aestuariibaculum sediminum]MBD0830556.1 phosphoethanolamine transferase [Aestuariibaculum sediminum]
MTYLLYFTIETSTYLALKSTFNSSFMYVLIETNIAELIEVFQAYLSSKILLVLVIMIGLALFYKKLFSSFEKTLKKQIALVICVSILVGLKFTGYIEQNLYHNMLRGVYGYYELQNKFSQSDEIQQEIVLNYSNDNEVFVLVLGESTNRNHMGIYGYTQESTPLLSSMQDSLYVFADVVSTDVLTLKAVPKMLTALSNSGHAVANYNLVELFNAAGYNTYWLSNQRPISYHDNAISKIASYSKFLKFFNYKVDKYATVYDGTMISEYDKILNEEGKKLIVLRLIGTHFDYENRYPDDFAKFKPKTKTKRDKIISHYDNAVLYNDYVVYTLINKLKQSSKKSALLYVSDHGENVFDDANFFGRTEEKITASMFEIPFILWASKDFKKPNDFIYERQRKFMCDHLYESVLHLNGITYKRLDSTRSVFSSSFKERKRIIVNDVDFDEYFVK